MPENKGHSAESVDGLAAARDGDNPSGDALGLRDVLTISGGTVDPCNVTSNLHFRFDSSTGNTLVEVKSPEGSGMVAQQIVLQGVDLTSHGSLTDSQVIQLLLTQGKLSTEI